MTLTEFLLARIAEDELDADCYPDPPIHREVVEAKAKRRIVELHTGDHECVGIKYGKQDTVYVHPDFIFRHDPTLCLLALPYVDHADFNEEWRT